jgi:Mlc titration factor MtfA (ptsG expression regulator)
MLTNIIIFTLVIIVVAYLWNSYNKANKKEWTAVDVAFSETWKAILTKNVSFYDALTNEQKINFEKHVLTFLHNVKITGVKTSISDEDKLMVAASAIIPIFGFPNWQYPNVREVLIYPNSFDDDFQFEGNDGEKQILGMVGNKHMDGVVILSQKALRLGFQNETDKKNTAIHEFVHLIDMSDGNVDGIPAVIMDKQYAMPWVDLIHKEINRIYENESDINPYGATNNAEFLAVISEYFFERPDLLEKKHPKLYALLEKTFNQDMDEHYKKMK